MESRRPSPVAGDDDTVKVARVVDDELSKLGWSQPARQSFLGDMGRENNWNRKTIFGGHRDPKNNAQNLGIISWQGDRRTKLLKHMEERGVAGRDDDDALREMARFMDREMQESPEWKSVHQGMRDPNLKTSDTSKLLQRYIKYVPHQPFNSPDPEYVTKNNRKWAERAKGLGLGQSAPATPGPFASFMSSRSTSEAAAESTPERSLQPPAIQLPDPVESEVAQEALNTTPEYRQPQELDKQNKQEQRKYFHFIRRNRLADEFNKLSPEEGKSLYNRYLSGDEEVRKSVDSYRQQVIQAERGQAKEREFVDAINAARQSQSDTATRNYLRDTTSARHGISFNPPAPMERLRRGEPVESVVSDLAGQLTQRKENFASQIKQGVLNQKSQANRSGSIDTSYTNSPFYGMSDKELNTYADKKASEALLEEFRQTQLRAGYTPEDLQEIEKWRKDLRSKGGLTRARDIGIASGAADLGELLAGGARVADALGLTTDATKRLQRASLLYRDVIAQSAADSPQTTLEKGVTLGVATLPKLVTATIATGLGGPVGGFATLGGLEAAGRGGQPGDILTGYAKGGAIGAVFKGTHGMALLPKVGVVGGSTYALEKSSGASDEEAKSAALANAVFAAFGGEKSVQSILGKLLRLNRDGKTVYATVDQTPEGQLRLAAAKDVTPEAKSQAVDFDLQNGRWTPRKSLPAAPDAPIRAAESTPSVPQSPAPVPESPETLSRQIQAMREGKRDAVLVTEGESMPMIPPDHLTTKTDAGTFIHPKSIRPKEIRAAVRNDTYPSLLGIVAPDANLQSGPAVVALDPQTGVEIQAAAVSTPEEAQRQIEEFEHQYPEAKVEISTVEGVTQARGASATSSSLATTTQPPAMALAPESSREAQRNTIERTDEAAQGAERYEWTRPDGKIANRQEIRPLDEKAYQAAVQTGSIVGPDLTSRGVPATLAEWQKTHPEDTHYVVTQGPNHSQPTITEIGPLEELRPLPETLERGDARQVDSFSSQGQEKQGISAAPATQNAVVPESQTQSSEAVSLEESFVPVHHSQAQPRRQRNTRKGTRGQFKKASVAETSSRSVDEFMAKRQTEVSPAATDEQSPLWRKTQESSTPFSDFMQERESQTGRVIREQPMELTKGDVAPVIRKVMDERNAPVQRDTLTSLRGLLNNKLISRAEFRQRRAAIRETEKSAPKYSTDEVLERDRRRLKAQGLEPKQLPPTPQEVSERARNEQQGEVYGSFPFRQGRARSAISLPQRTPSAQKDTSVTDYLRTPQSNLGFKGTYERRGQTRGKNVSNAFRKAQYSIEDRTHQWEQQFKASPQYRTMNKGQREAARKNAEQLINSQELDDLRAALQPHIDYFKRNGKPGLAEDIEIHLKQLRGRPSDFEKAVGRFIHQTPGLQNTPRPEYAMRTLATKLQGIQSTLKLKYNLKSSIVNLTDPLTTLWPYVSTKDFAALYAKLMRPGTRKRLRDLGVFESPDKLDEGRLRKIGRMSPFRAASSINRGIAYLYGEKDARRLGLTGQDAHWHAKDWARKVEFDNSVWNAPPILRTPGGKVLGQFKGYTVKAFENMSTTMKPHPNDIRFISRALRVGKFALGKGVVGGVKATGAFAKYSGAVLLIGVLVKALVDAGMEKEEAEQAAQAVFYGAPSLLGIDLSGSVMMFEEPFGKTWSEKVINFFGGPTVSDAVKIGQGVSEAMFAEDFDKVVDAGEKTVKGVTPYYRMGQAGVDLATEGSTSINLDKKKTEISNFEGIMRALGFTLTQQSRYYDEKDARRLEKKVAGK